VKIVTGLTINEATGMILGIETIVDAMSEHIVTISEVHTGEITDALILGTIVEITAGKIQEAVAETTEMKTLVANVEIIFVETPSFAIRIVAAVMAQGTGIIETQGTEKLEIETAQRKHLLTTTGPATIVVTSTFHSELNVTGAASLSMANQEHQNPLVEEGMVEDRSKTDQMMLTEDSAGLRVNQQIMRTTEDLNH
tara:strand:+ start:170 stop:760 length:591 start_codon:yes stop_codon:yes gene_type:complete